MTKLLVLSDSHGGRAAIERVLMKREQKLDALIFLGDGLRDLELALTLYPKLRAYSVAATAITVHWNPPTALPPLTAW